VGTNRWGKADTSEQGIQYVAPQKPRMLKRENGKIINSTASPHSIGLGLVRQTLS